jgi:glycosyltransferase involved in cell wall biosynthesis
VPDSLSILMMSHARRFKIHPRPYPMAKQLVQRGHHVTFIVIADRRRLGVVETECDGIRIVETPDLLCGKLRSGWDPWDTLNRILYLRRDSRPYDLVYTLETRPATIYPVLYYLRRHPVPWITEWIDWWGRGGIIDELRPRWYRVLFGRVETYYEEAFRTRADGVVAISTALAERAVGLGVRRERIFVLPNGTQPEAFSVPDAAACRRKVGLDVTGPIIGYCSLDTHLDLALMIEVFAQVVHQYPHARLLITGHAPRKIAKLAQALGVEENLILTGLVPFDELPWYLGCADLFVMPFPETIYNIGRWPGKISDYMSVGRPTITNPVGDIKGLFEKHRIGLLAKWDRQDFAQKISFLLEHPDVAREMGENARTVAVVEYDWKLLVAKLEKFFHQIIDMRRGASTSLEDTSPDNRRWIATQD